MIDTCITMDVTSPQNINTDNIEDNVCVPVFVNIDSFDVHNTYDLCSCISHLATCSICYNMPECLSSFVFFLDGKKEFSINKKLISQTSG